MANLQQDYVTEVLENVWDDVLFPAFRASIRGTMYGVITRDQMDEQCYNFARRAIAAFKFPKISTDYITFYAERDPETNYLTILEEEDENNIKCIPHGQFTNKLTYSEIEVIVAWMKVYWCEYQLSNADNFEDLYTDVNIKTFSRANMVEKNTKLFEQYKADAREMENRYSRVTSTRKSSLGEINSDE